jgi:hypothetical protein
MHSHGFMGWGFILGLLALLDPLAVGGAKSQSKRDRIKTRIERARAILSDFEGPLA